jgi:hypothetical protein
VEIKGEKERASASVVTREHILLCTKNITNNGSVWLLDSGASDHMMNRKDLMHDFASTNGELVVSDGAPIKIVGKGRVTLEMFQECGGNDTELKDVLYIPELQII